MRPAGIRAMVLPRMRRLAALALLPLLACASSRVSMTGDVQYGKSAEEDYKFGLDELQHQSYADAGKFLDHVKAKYPFSKYAALADLRLADIKYEQEKYIEAADAYDNFLKLHPTHEEADYAQFRAAEARFKDAPGDFFLFPPSYEKDRRQLVTAIGSLEQFLKDRSGSKYRDDAQKLVLLGKGRLADYEFYVGDFYWKRERWPGAAGRFERMVKQFPGAPQEPEALYRLALCYLRMDERFRAQQALQRLVARHPDDPRRREAEKLLAGLR